MLHKKYVSVLLSLSVGALASPVFGHPGHGATEPSSPWHAAEPVHLFPIMACVVAMALASCIAVRLWVRVRAPKPNSR